MKRKSKAIKGFHTVTFFRKVKDLISKELAGKTLEEKKKVLEQIRSGEIKLEVPE